MLRKINLNTQLNEFEKQILKEYLNEFQWCKSKAAYYLGVPRTVLLYKIRKFNLKDGKRI